MSDMIHAGAADSAAARGEKRPQLWRRYLLVSLCFVPVYFLARGVAQRLLFYAYGFSAVAAISVGVRAYRPRRRLPWIAFAFGLALFAMGDIGFDICAAIYRVTPVPSFADYVYFAAYPILAVGMILIVRYRVRGADLASALDGAMVAIGVGVLAWVFVMSPYARDSKLDLAGRVVPIVYPMLDLLLVAALVRLFLSRGARNRSFWLLSASVLALLVGDGLFAIATLHNAYSDGNVIDLGWILSYALWGSAALHPSMAALADPLPRVRAQRSRLEPIGLALAALTSPTMLIVEGARRGNFDEPLLAAASGVMFVLVLVRLSLVTGALDASNRRLARAADRQVVLTETALAFVGAADLDAAANVAVRGAVALAEQCETWSVFVVTEANCARVIAVAGPAPYAKGETVPGDLSANDRIVGPVMAGDHTLGFLVVSRCAATSDAVATISLVCSQMGLALQSIDAAEEHVRARNERQFQSLVQNSTDGVTLIEPGGIVRYRSPGARAILGLGDDSAVGEPWGTRLDAADADQARFALAEVIAGSRGATASFASRISRADGSLRDVDNVMTNLLDDPDVQAIVLNFRDVTERRALERELTRQAFSDSLTGLPNRALFLDRVTHALDRSDRLRGPIAVLVLDIDDFKTVNDSLGHPAGDELLEVVAARVKSAIRPGDTVARLGGDEFAVLLEAGNMPGSAHAVADRIAAALGAPIRIGTEDLAVTASIGISLGQPPVDATDDLLRDADLAMYMAKHNGKGRFEMFRPAMHEEAVRRLELAADLRRGIEQNQFEVFYQPIVNISTGVPIGAEALVRWHHPTRGLVSPVEFIPIAEATGLIVPLGRWVLVEACRQAQAWRRFDLSAEFYISVNVSARQLQDPLLVPDVAQALMSSGLPAHALLLEVTESVLIADLDSALARLRALKRLGLRLAIDDFGTGYSSLSYLRNFPMDVIKVDKSFVDRIALDAEGVAMVQGVIALSSALGLTSIAEGVEYEDQLALLHELGCDNVQGFLFAEPMPGDEFIDALGRLRAERTIAETTPAAAPC